MGFQISLCKFHKYSLSERLLDGKPVTLWDELTEHKAVSQKTSFQFLSQDISFFTLALYGIPIIILHITQEQTYSFPLRKSFAKTVLVEFAKWYLEALRGLFWKRKYHTLKTEKKVSEKMLCDMWLPLTELQQYFVELFASLNYVESEHSYFRSIRRQRDKGAMEIS